MPKEDGRMTLEEAQELKSKYESYINELLSNFHGLTKLKINNIFLSGMDIGTMKDGPNKKFMYTVELDIRL